MKNKNKKKKNEKVPEYGGYKVIFVDGNSQQPESGLVFARRMAIKILLVFITTFGLCASLSQVYAVEISKAAVFLVCLASVVIFSVGLLFYKKRLILALLLFFFVLWRESILYNLALLGDFMLHRLDSRLLSTARLARYSLSQIEVLNDGVDKPIASAFLVICILISLLFVIASRRYIGIMFVSSVLMFAPAFGAEIAGYVPGIKYMLAGMVGLYAAWVAHTPENPANAPENPTRENPGKNPQNQPPDYSRNFFKEILRVTPGAPHYYYKYGKNALIAATFAFVATVTASSIVTKAVDLDYRAIISSVRNAWESTIDFFNPNKVEDNGYFPDVSDGNRSRDISQGISLNRPPEGNTPIIRVTLEDDSEKIFLKGGIGIDFTGNEWTVTQDSPEYRQMLQLLQDYTPEMEYEQFFMRTSISSNSRHVDLMGFQRITIDYLKRTNFLLLPTNPFGDQFKTHPNYTWHGDTYIKAKNKSNAAKTEFDTVFPKVSNIGNIIQAANDYNWIFRRYTLVTETYRELLRSIYTDIPESEIANIDSFLDEVNIEYPTIPDIPDDVLDPLSEAVWGGDIPDWQLESYSGYSGYDGYIPGMFQMPGYYDYYSSSFSELPPPPPLHPIQQICDYLKLNYEYSLETDNDTGGDTVLGNFLFDTKSGHCAMYASVMTLAARRLGFPARYVTGVTTTPNVGKVQQMSEQNFHAWAEVYFDSVGWLPFDPTAASVGGEPVDNTDNETVYADETVIEEQETTIIAEETAVTDNSSETTAEKEQPALIAENSPESGQNRAVIAAIIGIAVAVLVIALLMLRKKAVSNRFNRFRNAKDDKTAAEMYRFMLKMLRSRGIKSVAGETPLEFSERADLELSAINSKKNRNLPPLSAVMPVCEKLEFGKEPLNAEEYNSLYRYVSELYYGK